MKITIATQKDIGLITKLIKELFDQEKEFEADYKLQRKALKSIIIHPKLGTIFIVKKNDKIVAMATLLYTISTAIGSKVAILEDVVVTKKHQGKKIGTKLLKHIIKYTKQHKIKRITLLTDHDNTKAHAFYKRLGFSNSSMIVFRKL